MSPKSASELLRWGQIWFVKGVVTPHGGNEKDRRVLLIDPEQVVPSSGTGSLYALGISTKATQSQIGDGTAIALPSRDKYPSTQSGLTEQSWAMASWLLDLAPCILDQQAGFVKSLYAQRAMEKVAELGTRPRAMPCPSIVRACDYCRVATA